MDYSKKPCNTCRRLLCVDKECDRWQQWFVTNWNLACDKIRDNLWNAMDKQGRQENTRCFRYLLPHEQKDPCVDCICKVWCDTPCSLRINWWNYRMAILRIACRK